MVPLQFGIPGGMELAVLIILFIAIPAAALYYWGKSRGQAEAMEYQDRRDRDDDK